MDNKIPHFKYHPDPVGTGAFETGKTVVCTCCDKETDIYVFPDCCKDAVYICPDCIYNGTAYDKFGWVINDIPSWIRDNNTGNVDESKIDELIQRTPGYLCWQHQVWPVHCSDFCAYLGRVNADDLKRLRIYKKIKTYLREEGAVDEGDYGTGERMKDPNNYAESILTGGCDRHLFRCLHCGKHLLHYDYD